MSCTLKQTAILGVDMIIHLYYFFVIKLEENPGHAWDFDIFLVKVEKALKGGPDKVQNLEWHPSVPHPPCKMISPF